jgi:hypothetical protein
MAELIDVMQVLMGSMLPVDGDMNPERGVNCGEHVVN